MHGTIPPLAVIASGRDAGFERVMVTANLRGLIVWAGVMAAASVSEIAFGLYSPAYREATAWELGAHLTAIAVAVFLLRARPDGGSALFPPVAFAVLLLIMQHTLMVSAWSGQLEDCYPLVLLGIPIVCLFPARRIGVILALTTASYLVFVVLLPPLPHEVKLLAARNTVLASIAATIASKLIHDPRRREWHQRALIEARGRELEEHYARLDELMAVTAHDLRSPLLGLRNLVRLTLDRAAADPQQALLSLGLADRSLRSILVLVNGLLDAHEAERGTAGATMSWDLRLMLADLVERATPSAQAAGVDIELVQPKTAVTMVTDFHSISRIVDNLLSNAIRYTPEGGRAAITLAHDEGRITITVSDEGPGVPEGDAGLIFDKFYRGDMAVGERQHGSGLGLFIARRLTQNLDGTLDYRANEPTGAVFVFSMPVR